MNAWPIVVTPLSAGPFPSGGLRVRLPHQQQRGGLHGGAAAVHGHLRHRGVHRVLALPECPPSVVHKEVLQALRHSRRCGVGGGGGAHSFVACLKPFGH